MSRRAMVRGLRVPVPRMVRCRRMVRVSMVRPDMAGRIMVRPGTRASQGMASLSTARPAAMEHRGMAPSSHSTGAPYGAAQYPPYPPYGANPYGVPAYYAPNDRWNTMSIVGFVLSFVFCPAGLILSIIALRQINRTQERGKAFAIAGIVISAIAIVIVIITIIFAIAVGVYMVNHPETWNGSYCINGDCVYKDYGDSAFTSLAIMPLAALIG